MEKMHKHPGYYYGCYKPASSITLSDLFAVADCPGWHWALYRCLESNRDPDNPDLRVAYYARMSYKGRLPVDLGYDPEHPAGSLLENMAGFYERQCKSLDDYDDPGFRAEVREMRRLFTAIYRAAEALHRNDSYHYPLPGVETRFRKV